MEEIIFQQVVLKNISFDTVTRLLDFYKTL